MKGAVGRRAGLFLFLGLVCVYLSVASLDGPAVGDGKVMLHLAKGLYDEVQAKELEEAGLDLQRYGLGQVLLDVPVTPFLDAAELGEPTERALATLALTTLPAVTAALTAFLLLLLARSFGHRGAVPAILAVAAGLGTMSFVYAQSHFSEPTVGLLWLAALLGIRRHGETGRMRWLALVGACLGYAVLTKATAAPGSLVLGLLALRSVAKREAGRPRALAALAGPAAAALALVLWYNHHRYGSVFDFGYVAGRDAELGFATPLGTGLFGLLLSPGKGLFFYNPVLILAIVGLPAFLRRHRPEGVAILVLAVAQLLLAAKWWAWSGDYAWGPRLMLPVIPLLLLFAASPLTAIAERIRAGGRRLRASVLATGALLVVSVLVQIPGLAISYHRYPSLVLIHVPVFAGSFHDPESWPIRDDLVHVHFIPEFSPIPGHLWMMRVAADRDAPWPEPPWASLNPLWMPRGRGMRDRFRFSPFWLRALAEDQPGRGAMTALAAALAALGAGYLVVSVRRSRGA